MAFSSKVAAPGYGVFSFRDFLELIFSLLFIIIIFYNFILFFSRASG